MFFFGAFVGHRAEGGLSQNVKISSNFTLCRMENTINSKYSKLKYVMYKVNMQYCIFYYNYFMKCLLFFIVYP